MEARGLSPGARRGAYGGGPFAGLVLFVLLVYLNPGNLFLAGAGDVGIAKGAAAVALCALGLSALLYDRPLHLGGAIGRLLLVYFGLVAASISWSLWPAMTAQSVLDAVKYLAIFFLVVNAVDSRERAAAMVHALALCSVIPAIGALHSYSIGEHLVEGDRAAWIGIFANPNNLAYHLLVGIAMALGARELTRKAWLRFVYLGAMATMAAAILYTQSRGGLIASCTVLGLWAIRGLRRGRTLLGVAAIVALAVYLAPTATWQRAETTLAYQKDASAEGRIDAWRTGLNVVEGRPLTGVGSGVFALSWAEYAPGDAGPPRAPHNTFVQVAAETGVPSFVLFGLALAAAVVGLSRTARAKGADRRAATIARCVQVGLGGFTVSSLTGGNAWSWPLYLLLGLAAALMRVEAGNAEAGDGESRADRGVTAAGSREEESRASG